MPTKTKKRVAKANSKGEADYRAFLRTLNLRWIALESSTVKIERDDYFSKVQKELALTWTCHPSGATKESFQLRAEGSATLKNPATGQELFSVVAVFLMAVDSSRSSERQHIERLSNVEARLMFWPYFREYVSQTCGRMHVPPLFLPLTGTRY